MEKIRNALLYIVIGIFLISLTSAVYDAGIYEQNKIVDLKLPCSFNGTFCTTTATCNATVEYLNSTLALDAELMTNLGNGMPNVTLPFSNITGNYEGFYICCESGYCDSSSITFEITPTGRTLSTAQGIVYVVFLISIIFVFFLCGYGAISIPWSHPRDSEGKIIGVNELKYVKLTLYVFSYILLMFMVGIIKSIMENFLSFDNASRVFNWMFWVMFSLLWPIIVVSLILTLIYFLDNKKMQKAILRGVPIR